MNKQEMLERVEAYVCSFGARSSYERILDAMDAVDRRDFMPDYSKEDAYFDCPMNIGSGQTISQPSTVARMLQILELKKGDYVLEIGTGSGWNAALISYIVGSNGRVATTEIREELAMRARENLKRAGAKNLEVIAADFSRISRKFDKIIFTAGISDEQESMMEKFAKTNLNNDGILVCPYRSGPLIVIKKSGSGRISKTYSQEYYVFVPLSD